MAVMEESPSNSFSARTLHRQLGDLALLVVALISLQMVAFGQVSLNGRVTDENNVPVDGAHVSLGSAVSTGSQIPLLQTLSDPTGAFTLRLQNSGNYLVSVELEGYFRLQDQPLALGEGDNQVTLILNHQRQLVESVNVAYSPHAIDFEQTNAQKTLTSTELVDIPYPTSHELRN